MRRVFNCGIGMILVVPREEAGDVIHRLEALGERAYRVGHVEPRKDGEPAVVFEAGSTAS
jgi:phosphoribosylformylglycinamidine cyclo-ligase